MSDQEMAEKLFRRFDETDDEEERQEFSASSKKRRKRKYGEGASQPPKRQQVNVACNRCRKKKIKCDALRPCTVCKKINTRCSYDTEGDETRVQAAKRKQDESIRALTIYNELFDLIGKSQERDVLDMSNMIQNGYGPAAVLNFLRKGGLVPDKSIASRVALEAFLISLAHSTGSLPEIIKLATWNLSRTTNIRLPDPDEYRLLRNRIIQPPDVEALLQRSSADKPAGERSLLARGDIVTDAIDEIDAPIRAYALPWTQVTASDAAVSHLVSLFFSWINPTWRFVEQDLFLKGMGSRQPFPDLCTPLLVNSICALASMHSEHDVAFPRGDRDRITRGQHFHNEAIRLWTLEEGRPTLTNVQALCILTLESNYRAKDRLGLSLVSTALRLDADVPLHADESRCTAQGITTQEHERARLSTRWMVKCTHVIMQIAFMSGVRDDSRPPSLSQIRQVFDDDVEDWKGYPFDANAVPHRPTMYLHERCRLGMLFQQMHDLILRSSSTADVREFVHAVDELSAEMREWFGYLPSELHYRWPMSVAVWELHASYLAFSMILQLTARNRCRDTQASSPPAQTTTGPSERDEDGEDDETFASRMAELSLSNAIELAHLAAQILQDFRRRYGLKVPPAWLLQLQAVTAGVLMLDPELANPSVASPSKGKAREGTITDSFTAFDEVFRCLLGTGVELMIARGIARMMYRTALEKKVELSQSTRSMLHIMADTTWRRSDLFLVNSVYPNFATTKGCDDRERMTEMLTRWEKLEV